jgi:hypothetical protein
VFEMFLTSIRLFLRGKLFQDPWHVFRLGLLGAGATAALHLLLGFAGLPLPAAATPT